MRETSGKFTRAQKAEQVVDLDAIFEAIHWREFKILLKPEAFSDPASLAAASATRTVRLSEAA